MRKLLAKMLKIYRVALDKSGKRYHSIKISELLYSLTSMFFLPSVVLGLNAIASYVLAIINQVFLKAEWFHFALHPALLIYYRN